MTTLEPIRSDPAASFVYYGEREGWLIALNVHRDSDALERSNWRIITPSILAADPNDAAIERMNHWAVGWIDYLLVRPGSPAQTAAEGWAERLANYPVADEEDFSALEFGEEWCVRCDRGTREDHYETTVNGAPLNGTCRKFRSADDADEIRYRWQHRKERV